MKFAIEIRRYVTDRGRDIFGDWMSRLRDPRAKAKIAVRISRLATGNFGDCKPLGHGVCELRIDWGPGYRAYYTMVGAVCVLLLCAGDKRTQAADIERARGYLKNYRQRTSADEA